MKGIFNLQNCENKPFFPYKFNKFSNKGIYLSTLPPFDDYFPEAMKIEKYRKFQKWWIKILLTKLGYKNHLGKTHVAKRRRLPSFSYFMWLKIGNLKLYNNFINFRYMQNYNKPFDLVL